MSITLSFQILSDFCPIPALYSKIPAFNAKVPARYGKISVFYANIYIFGFQCAGNLCGQFLVSRLRYVSNGGTRGMRRRGGGGGRGHADGKNKSASVHTKLFCRAIYCAKPRPDPEYHSGSRY